MAAQARGRAVAAPRSRRASPAWVARGSRPPRQAATRHATVKRRASNHLEQGPAEIDAKRRLSCNPIARAAGPADGC